MKQLILPLLLALSLTAFSTDYSFTIQGKNYKLVKTKKSWVDAAAWAVQDGGHLVHINSKAEQDSIWAAISASGISMQYTVVSDGGGVAYIWIGGTDKVSEGTWLWDGDNDGNGTVFYSGQGSWGTGNGAPVNGAYVNWGGTNTGAGSNEPDDYGSSQDGAAIALEPWPAAGMGNVAGEWNDINLSNQLYFIVEYETASLNKQQNMIIPPLMIINKGSNKLNFSSSVNIQNLKIYSLSGALLREFKLMNRKQIDVFFDKKGIYFYVGVFENTAVRRGKILLM